MLQGVTLVIFDASKTPNKTTFDKIVEERIKPSMPHAYDHFMKLDRALWTHHASSQTTGVADQSTTNLVESNMQWLTADVSVRTCYSLGLPSTAHSSTSDRIVRVFRW